MSAHVWRGSSRSTANTYPSVPSPGHHPARGRNLVRANRVSEMTGCDVYLKVEGASRPGRSGPRNDAWRSRWPLRKARRR